MNQSAPVEQDGFHFDYRQDVFRGRHGLHVYGVSSEELARRAAHIAASHGSAGMKGFDTMRACGQASFVQVGAHEWATRDV